MLIGAIAAGLIVAGPADALLRSEHVGETRTALSLELRDLGMSILPLRRANSRSSEVPKEAHASCPVVPWVVLYGSMAVAQALGGQYQSAPRISMGLWDAAASVPVGVPGW
jgi:hypothetical protein